MKKLVKNHKGVVVNDEFKNFPKLRQRNIGVRKVKIKDILDSSIFNLKLYSLIWFKENPKYFENILDKLSYEVSLLKTKGKEEYRVTGGNNRIFFLKHFPKLTNHQDWILANVREINLNNAKKYSKLNSGGNKK